MFKKLAVQALDRMATSIKTEQQELGKWRYLVPFIQKPTKFVYYDSFKKDIDTKTVNLPNTIKKDINTDLINFKYKHFDENGVYEYIDVFSSDYIRATVLRNAIITSLSAYAIMPTPEVIFAGFIPLGELLVKAAMADRISEFITDKNAIQKKLDYQLLMLPDYDRAAETM